MNTVFVWLQHLLPQHLLSRCLGWLAERRHPRFLKDRVIRAFIRRYEVNLAEAEQPVAEAYPSFNAFFTRALRPGARPLADADVLCPADGAVSQIGRIAEDRLLQAKGRWFGLQELLGGDAARAAPYTGGAFCTIYLSPRDYHRVHMPLEGRLLATTYVPGRLFSVNHATAAGVDGLFARNERLVCHFEGPRGPFAMVLVGAMIVAGIDTVWSGPVVPPPRQPDTRDYAALPAPVALARGAEMGRFRLGSTVILLFPAQSIAWRPGYAAGSPTRVGEALADFAAA